MKPEILFLLTAEFPYGKGETFIENEITFLADAFDKVVILPLNKSGEKHRPIPSNVKLQPIEDQTVGWIRTLSKIFQEGEIFKEFSNNLLSNPLRNKILLKSVRNSINISNSLKTQLEKYRNSHKCFLYSYWLDDAALGIAFLENDHVKVSRAHRWDIYTEKHLYNYLPLRKYLAQKLTRIFSISDDGAEYLKKSTGHPSKISLSRLGVIARRDFDESCSETGLNIISVSYIIARKRLELIGEAVKLLSSNKISWKHFGDGPDLPKIKNLYSFGEFYGFVNNTLLTRTLGELSDNSILINTSTSEGIPVSMMEAMSFGIPCIGTDVGGVAEIIEDGVNGFLMPANPTPQIVSKYIKKYDNLSMEEKQLFRRNAYRTWSEKFNAEKNYKSFINEIISLDNQ